MLQLTFAYVTDILLVNKINKFDLISSFKKRTHTHSILSDMQIRLVAMSSCYAEKNNNSILIRDITDQC